MASKYVGCCSGGKSNLIFARFCGQPAEAETMLCLGEKTLMPGGIREIARQVSGMA